MSDSSKLSTDPYKGVRDFYPEDLFVLNYIFKTMRNTVEKFGYVEYNASILEPTELYRSKTSEEIVNEQTYSFKDRGDRDVTLRPEMTPTVARLVAARQREIGFPLRWYSIPNVFRYEQPQRGRLREHWQLNVDLFGANSPASILEADIEVITVAYEIMKSFGAKDSDFEIKINNKDTIRRILESEKLTPEEIKKYLSLLDKKSKLSEEDFKKREVELIGRNISYKSEIGNHTKQIIDKLSQRGIKNVHFDEYLVRGFDYYTGVVFEVFDTNPENRRSIFGGGRYDNLTSNFGGDAVPAVGFGMGDVTIRDFLETRNLIPAYKSPVQIYIGILDNQHEYASEVAQKLRDVRINVFVNFEDKDLRDHFKLIEKRAIPYAIFIGAKEKDREAFSLRDIQAKKDIREFSQEDSAEIAEFIKKNK